MRRLWIQRHRRFAACTAAMKVYIEDLENGTVRIQGKRCRKLGVLKNGVKKAFSIEEDAARVFVIAGKLDRNTYSEFYDIPAGRDDVFLSGGNAYNPFAGNPFRFDGVTDVKLLENRRNAGRKGILILVLALVLGILLGVAGMMNTELTAEEPKVFSAEGMQITLTEEFDPVQMEGFHACFGTPETVVFVLREEFAATAGLEELSLEDYGRKLLKSNGFNENFELLQIEKRTVFEYVTMDASGDEWYYLSSLYRDRDAFWMVQFACLQENADVERMHDFLEWADSVTFENN